MKCAATATPPRQTENPAQAPSTALAGENLRLAPSMGSDRLPTLLKQIHKSWLQVQSYEVLRQHNNSEYVYRNKNGENNKLVQITIIKIQKPIYKIPNNKNEKGQI
ncbi:hypothetical protein CDAR_57141 [Caerostris darwini]|uniref:Uncharacterized protein n=1 Tax=Caerostris darwini TaxID=1538125 RepID=A0AAV4WAV9_9ARAC|nr:hypothetical protein CDAR_57141 [Caerostris darwini]